MIRFLSLDAKTRNSLIQEIRDSWRKENADAIISFCEESSPESIETLVDSMWKLIKEIKDVPDMRLRSMEAVVKTLKGGKAKSGDWRTLPRTSRKRK